MMRKVIIFLVFVGISVATPAYGQRWKRLKEYSAGLTLGANMTDIRLTADSYNIYQHQWQPHPIAGAYFQYRSEDGFSFRPEVMYYGRGGILTCSDIRYQLLAHCIGLRVGMRLDYVVPRTLFTFYGIVTPELAFTIGGSVDYTSTGTGPLNMSLSRSNMNVVDLGAFCGLGVEFSVFFDGDAIYLSFETGYHFNIINSFTSQEATGAITVLNYINLPPSAQKSRLSGGIEAMFRIGIPFGNYIRIKR